MLDNELIAEFMCVETSCKGIGKVAVKAYKYPDYREIPFIYTWDWLMPIGKKCRDIINAIYEEQNPELFHYYSLIERAMKAYDLKQTVEAIMGFIKHYKKSLEEKTAYENKKIKW